MVFVIIAMNMVHEWTSFLNEEQIWSTWAFYFAMDVQEGFVSGRDKFIQKCVHINYGLCSSSSMHKFCLCKHISINSRESVSSWIGEFKCRVWSNEIC